MTIKALSACDIITRIMIAVNNKSDRQDFSVNQAERSHITARKTKKKKKKKKKGKKGKRKKKERKSE